MDELLHPQWSENFGINPEDLLLDHMTRSSSLDQGRPRQDNSFVERYPSQHQVPTVVHPHSDFLDLAGPSMEMHGPDIDMPTFNQLPQHQCQFPFDGTFAASNGHNSQGFRESTAYENTTHQRPQRVPAPWPQQSHSNVPVQPFNTASMFMPQQNFTSGQADPSFANMSNFLSHSSPPDTSKAPSKRRSPKPKPLTSRDRKMQSRRSQWRGPMLAQANVAGKFGTFNEASPQEAIALFESSIRTFSPSTQLRAADLICEMKKLVLEEQIKGSQSGKSETNLTTTAPSTQDSISNPEVVDADLTDDTSVSTTPHQPTNDIEDIEDSMSVIEESATAKHETCRECGVRPLFHCTLRNCGYSTHQFADWKRHEAGYKHWPQEQFICIECIDVPFMNGQPVCKFCLVPASQLGGNLRSHYAYCKTAKMNGTKFGRKEKLINHLRKYHGTENMNGPEKHWKYTIDSKWPKDCGFCVFRFNTWEERQNHLKEHFEEGKDISDWEWPSPKSQDFRPQGSNLPKNDGGDDDDDDKPNGGSGGIWGKAAGQQASRHASSATPSRKSRSSGNNTQTSSQTRNRPAEIGISTARLGKSEVVEPIVPSVALERYLNDTNDPVGSRLTLGDTQAVLSPITVAVPAEKAAPRSTENSRIEKSFFQPGRVFSILRIEPNGENTYSKTVQSLGLPNQKGFSKIRRFVVLELGSDHCTCFPVITYDDMICKKRDLDLNSHGIIHSSGIHPPRPADITKMPLKLKLSDRADDLANPSFINYGKVYTVETNVNVKDIGTLESESRRLLLVYYKKSHPQDFQGRDLAQYPSPIPTIPGHVDTVLPSRCESKDSAIPDTANTPLSLALKPAPKTSHQRPHHDRVFCDQCTSHSDGFRGKHELRRHKDRKHKVTGSNEEDCLSSMKQSSATGNDFALYPSPEYTFPSFPISAFDYNLKDIGQGYPGPKPCSFSSAMYTDVPQSALEPPSFLSLPSECSAAVGPTATSSAMGSPSLMHGQITPVPEWTCLGVSPEIDEYNDYNDYSTTLDQAYSFAGYLEILHASSIERLGFVDPSIIHNYETFDDTAVKRECAPNFRTAGLEAVATGSPYGFAISQHRFGSQSPYLSTYPAAGSYPYPRRPSVQSYSSEDHSFSSETLIEKGRCTYPECGKVFKDLKAHMLTHQTERPEKCPIQTCDYHVKGFARKYDKNQHTLTHYKGTMVCGFCPGLGSVAEKSFNRADVFKRHLISAHRVEQTPPNLRNRTSGNGSKRLSGYAFDATGKCSTCSSSDLDVQTMRRAEDFHNSTDESKDSWNANGLAKLGLESVVGLSISPRSSTSKSKMCEMLFGIGSHADLSPDPADSNAFITSSMPNYRKQNAQSAVIQHFLICDSYNRK